jgi:hypothetical protein
VNRGEIHQLNAGIEAHSLDLLGTMKRSIIHNEDRLWFWPPVAMLQKLLDEGFENIGIGSALKYPSEHNSILSICSEYLIASIPVELRNLDWCHTERGPTGPSKLSPFVTA